jgi:hypothetical protein
MNGPSPLYRHPPSSLLLAVGACAWTLPQSNLAHLVPRNRRHAYNSTRKSTAAQLTTCLFEDRSMTSSMRECIRMASTFAPLGHMIKMPSIFYCLGQTAFCGCSWFNRSLAQVSILESSTFGSNEPSNSPLASRLLPRFKDHQKLYSEFRSSYWPPINRTTRQGFGQPYVVISAKFQDFS